MVMTSLKNPDSRLPEEDKYPALRIVLWVWKGLVLAQVVGTVAFVLFAWDTMDERNEVPVGLFVIAVALVWGVIQWAAAELVQVFMDIEENTRRMAERV